MAYGPRAAAVERTRQKRLAVVRAFKETHPCEECGEADARCLDLHHRDPADKHPMLARRRNGRNGWSELSFAAIEVELTKCFVLCANCHRKHHSA